MLPPVGNALKKWTVADYLIFLLNNFSANIIDRKLRNNLNDIYLR